MVNADRRTASAKVQRIAETLKSMYGFHGKGGRRSNPLDTLIGTLLSQNTNDRNSYRAWVNLRRKFPSWDKVAAAPLTSVSSAIKVGGLRNQKARRIKEILARVRRDWGGYHINGLHRMANDEAMNYLLSMKGIGEKTAACVLVFSLKRDVFPVDTHIHRVCNRLGLVRTKSAAETFKAMSPLVPEGTAYSFHVNVIRFGRELCGARRPVCVRCPLFEDCTYERKYEFHGTAGGKRIGRDVRDFMVIEHLAKKKS